MNKPILLSLILFFIFCMDASAKKIKAVIYLPTNFSLQALPKSIKQVANGAQDFVKGALIAADTFSKLGNDVKLYVLESNGILSNAELLKDTLQKIQPDFIIGPFEESGIRFLDQVCADLKIKLVSPVFITDSCLKSPNYVQSNPGINDYGKIAAQLINNEYRDRRVVLINFKTTSKDPVSIAFVKDINKDSLKVIDLHGKDAINIDLVKELSPAKNIIFIPSRNEYFVSKVLSKLQSDSSEESIVIGLYNMINNKSIGYDLWGKFKIHIITPNQIDYRDQVTQYFIQKYRNNYNEEPNEISFKGYDDMFLHLYSAKNNQNLLDNEFKLIHTKYSFEKGSCDNMTKNKSLFIYHYTDKHEFIQK